MRFLKKILVFCFASLLIYTVTAIVFQVHTGTELSSTLTERFFTVFGVELAAMAALRISENVEKMRQERREEKAQEEAVKVTERKARQRNSPTFDIIKSDEVEGE